MFSFELYDKVIEAYKSGDENRFVAAARNWLKDGETPAFADAEAINLFTLAKIDYSRWVTKSISGRISKIRMVEKVRKIAEKGLPNPYRLIPEPELEPIKAEEPAEEVPAEAPELPAEPMSEETPAEPASEETPAEESKDDNPRHYVFGVVPEEKPRVFGKRKKR